MNKNFKTEKTNQSVAKTTCYMCACRCGIDVHVKNNEVIHIEGNRDHPVNKGVLCAKGSSGIFQHKAASRLQKPLLREGERGEGKFKEISWEKALEIAVKWLKPLRKNGTSGLVDFIRVAAMMMPELMDEWFESKLVRGAVSAAGITLITTPRI